MRLRNIPLILAASATLLATVLAFAQDAERAEDGDFVFGDEAAWGDSGPEGTEGEDEVKVDAPPPAHRGVIQGVLRDGNGNPAFEGKVSVPGTDYVTYTDVHGRFRLELPPGTYSVRFFVEAHEPAQLQGVVVTAGQVEELNLHVEAREGAVQEIEVIGVLEKNRIEGILLARQRSGSVGDTIGRIEISKTPDSNAAEAAQRVVGATIVGGRFVYVRGLGERYSNALFDGAPLPSPEPDRAAVPLDLFPVAVMDSVTIVKTFTPDIPADFAGGSVQVETRSIPDDLVFSAGVSGGYVTGTTFHDRPTLQGSKTDWLGFDSGRRALPDGVPSDYALIRDGERSDGTVITAQDLAGWAQRFNSSMSWSDTMTPPNHGLNLVVGNGWKLGGDQKLGAIASLTYGRSFNSYDMKRRDFIFRDGEVGAQYDYDTQVSQMKVNWGALGSVAYAPHKDHQLRLVLVRSQLAEDELEVFQGVHEEYAFRDVAGVRGQFVARALNIARLTGQHEFEEANDGKLSWSALYSVATRDEPDSRDAAWVRDTATNEYEFITNGDSGRHFWSDMSERGLAGTIDYEQPLGLAQAAKVKLGGAAQIKDRDFVGRRFVYAGSSGRTNVRCGETFGPSCPDDTFREELFDDFGGRVNRPTFTFEEKTANSDGYDAELDVYATYVMTDVNLLPDLRLILGERFESTRQTIKPKDFGFGDADSARLVGQDLLPSASVVYSATSKAKLRGAVTRTLARPQLRELAPFSFNEVYGGRIVSGNPDLELTHITNVDLRFEYFPSLREVAAFSVFYKNFEDPIEPTITPSGGASQLTYVNSPGAKLIGVEFEARKHLDFISPKLEDFSTVANVTLAHSRIALEQTGNRTLTSTSRPLVNQAPWVLNLALDYDNEDSGTKLRASLNLAGRRVEEVGTSGIPDGYRQPAALVDVTGTQGLGKGFRLKAGVEDLLNSEVLITAGKERNRKLASRSYRDGSVIFVGISYDL